jgi:hypothetical protein
VELAPHAVSEICSFINGEYYIMSTIFGEGSLGKKIITWVSAIIIVLPIVAYSTVESVEVLSQLRPQHTTMRQIQ